MREHESNYARVNGLEMYYEIHGAREPLVLLLGGGVMGDLAGLPKSRLAVLPGTSHFVPPEVTHLRFQVVKDD